MPPPLGIGSLVSSPEIPLAELPHGAPLHRPPVARIMRWPPPALQISPALGTRSSSPGCALLMSAVVCSLLSSSIWRASPEIALLSPAVSRRSSSAAALYPHCRWFVRHCRTPASPEFVGSLPSPAISQSIVAAYSSPESDPLSWITPESLLFCRSPLAGDLASSSSSFLH